MAQSTRSTRLRTLVAAGRISATGLIDFVMIPSGLQQPGRRSTGIESGQGDGRPIEIAIEIAVGYLAPSTLSIRPPPTSRKRRAVTSTTAVGMPGPRAAAGAPGAATVELGAVGLADAVGVGEA
jgi:hypothetical protein